MNELPIKITPAAVAHEIVRIDYFTAAQALEVTPTRQEDSKVTFCYLTLRNGTKIVGINYGAITDSEHDPEMGKKMALRGAEDKVYEMLGYELRTRIAEQSQPLSTAK